MYQYEVYVTLIMGNIIKNIDFAPQVLGKASLVAQLGNSLYLKVSLSVCRSPGNMGILLPSLTENLTRIQFSM